VVMAPAVSLAGFRRASLGNGHDSTLSPLVSVE
jgi:hypothetical protein